MDPNNESAYQMKGDLFKTNLKIDEALAQYSKAVQINPESSSAISSIGDVLKFRGQWTEALQHYKKSLTLNENQPETLMQLIQTKLNCCDWENFWDYWQRLAVIVRD